MDPIFEQFLVPAPGNPQQRDGAIVAAVPLPSPRVEVSVRLATMDDLPFVDSLQKMHSHMVGFFNKKTMEKYIEDGNVLVAEQHVETSKSRNVDMGGPPDAAAVPFDVSTCRRLDVSAQPLDYIISRDQYMKRDDVGIIYQLNVAPIQQRHLIGATLVKSAFERAAYGCRLFCCWCAQDIQANYFWESIGFTPIAFRTGSRAKQRIHIFWQKRIREGDAPGNENCTPWWYPHQTQNGAVAEDRIVLPIPPGTHWRDAKPLILPASPLVPSGMEAFDSHGRDARATDLPKSLPGGAAVSPRPEESRVKLTPAQRAAIARMQSAQLGGVPLGKKAVLTAGGVKYVERSDFVPEMDVPAELQDLLDPEAAKKKAAAEKKAKRAKRPRTRSKHDKEQVAAARELRDRYLDAVNSGRMALPSAGDAKYDVSRQLPGAGFTAEHAEGAEGGQREGARIVDGPRGYLEAA